MKKVIYHRSFPNQQLFVKTHMIVARELEQQLMEPNFSH